MEADAGVKGAQRAVGKDSSALILYLMHCFHVPLLIALYGTMLLL